MNSNSQLDYSQYMELGKAALFSSWWLLHFGAIHTTKEESWSPRGSLCPYSEVDLPSQANACGRFDFVVHTGPDGAVQSQNLWATRAAWRSFQLLLNQILALAAGKSWKSAKCSRQKATEFSFFFTFIQLFSWNIRVVKYELRFFFIFKTISDALNHDIIQN